MRRSLLTMVVAGGVPFTVGETNLTRSAGYGSGFGTIILTPTSPAAHSGTLTQVKFTTDTGGGGTVYFLSGSLNTGTSTFTVTDVSGSFTAAVGANTFATSFAINSGDVIAFWAPSAASTIVALSSATSHSWQFFSGVSSTVPPTPGQVITSGTDAGASQAICLQGSGS